MVMTHSQAPVVIGMDFLETYQCVLDMRTHTLINNDVVHICRPMESVSQIFRVRADDTVIIPPMSEMTIHGEIPESPYVTQCIIEEDFNFVCDRPTLVARAVLNPTQGTFLLCVMNLSEEPHEVNKGTNVAICEPVPSVGQPVSGNDGVIEDHCDLPDNVQSLMMIVKIFQLVKNLLLNIFFLIYLMILLVPKMISQLPTLINIV